jgi:hypothetical protein
MRQPPDLTESVNVRLTPKEKALLRREAGILEMTMSERVRLALFSTPGLEHVVVKRIPSPFRKGDSK